MLMVILVYRHESTNQCTKHMEWYKKRCGSRAFAIFAIYHSYAWYSELWRIINKHVICALKYFGNPFGCSIITTPISPFHSVIIALGKQTNTEAMKGERVRAIPRNFHSWKGQNAQNQIKELQRTNTTWKLTTTIKHYLQFRCVSIN